MTDNDGFLGVVVAMTLVVIVTVAAIWTQGALQRLGDRRANRQRQAKR